MGPTESCKYLPRTKVPVSLKRLLLLQKRVACQKKKLNAWLKKPNNSQRKTKRTSNGLMTTKKQRRKSSKKSRKNLKRRLTQSFKRFTKQVLVAKELHQKKKTWMSKTVMNFKTHEMYRFIRFDVQKEILAR